MNTNTITYTGQSQQQNLKNLKNIELNSLNTIINMCSQYTNVYASQAWLGAQTNNCRQTFNKSLRSLKDDFVYVTYRHKQTCTYKLNPIFGDPKFRTENAHLLPALKKFSIILYFSWLATLNLSTNNYISSLSTLESNSFSVLGQKFLNKTQKGEIPSFLTKMIASCGQSTTPVLCPSETYVPPEYAKTMFKPRTLEQKLYDLKKITVARENSYWHKRQAAEQKTAQLPVPVKPIIELKTLKQKNFALLLQSYK